MIEKGLFLMTVFTTFGTPESFTVSSKEQFCWITFNSLMRKKDQKKKKKKEDEEINGFLIVFLLFLFCIYVIKDKEREGEKEVEMKKRRSSDS